MTVKSSFDQAVVALKLELDSVGFLSSSKTAVDQELIDDIQSDMDTLVSTYAATFSIDRLGGVHNPTAEEMAHWLFDGVEHVFTIGLCPTSVNELLTFTVVFPFPWRL